MNTEIIDAIAKRCVFPQAIGDALTYGITKRELFAAMAMQAVRAANPACSSQEIAKDAVLDADALLKELDK